MEVKSHDGEQLFGLSFSFNKPASGKCGMVIFIVGLVQIFLESMHIQKWWNRQFVQSHVLATGTLLPSYGWMEKAILE